jgi:hypothetical protein
MSLFITTGSGSRQVKWYGVEFDLLSGDPAGVRIGDLNLHRLQPIARRMARCTLLDTGQVNYYLHPTNSALKADGSAANLTGVDGQFMTEVPAHYFKEELFETKLRWSFSETWIVGYIYIPKHYVSAGEACRQWSTDKLSCVVNASADYRGGANTVAWDAAANTLLGKPTTNLSRTSARAYAANRGAGWILEIPTIYNAWRRLMFAEFATRNMQLTFNAAMTVDGFRQGGLGAGVTNADGSEWNNFNGYNPFINIGATASLGNASGVIDVSVIDFGGAGINRTHQVPSYRGIENPWGHIWKWLDGYNILAQTVAEGSKTLLYYRDQRTGLADDTAVGYTLAGELSRAEGWAKNMLPGHLFPSQAGGGGTGSTTFWCDYFYTDAVTNFGWRAPFVGGHANTGSSAGPVYVNTTFAASSAYTSVGSRLCYLGA